MQRDQTLPDGRVFAAEAALHLGCKPRTLEVWRSQGIGPRYLRVAGRVQYRREDLDDYLEAHAVETTGHASGESLRATRKRRKAS